MKNDQTNRDRERLRIERAWAQVPFCAFCGVALDFESHEHKKDREPNPKWAVNRRLYRHIPEYAKMDLMGLKTSVVLCLGCNHKLDTLINERIGENARDPLNVLFERNGSTLKDLSELP